jgi:lysyl-tRNA synthetase class 2
LQFEPRDQFEQRLKKLEQIQALGHEAYPREFRWTDTPADLVNKYLETSGPDLEANKHQVCVAGRIVGYRLMGKMGFAHLQGAGRKIQLAVKKDMVGDAGFQLFHLLDLGDSIGVRGYMFRTKTNELKPCCRCRRSGMA